MTTSAQKVDVDAIAQLATPVVEGAGYELVDLEWKRDGGAWVLRLFIDKPNGPHAPGDGITLDACADVSRELSTLLDVSETLPDGYELEVGSPGIDRPLRREKDFRKVVGHKVKVRTQRPLGPPPGRRNFAGPLVEVVSSDKAILKIDVGDRTCEVPIDEVEKANLVYEFSSNTKSQRSGSR